MSQAERIRAYLATLKQGTSAEVLARVLGLSVDTIEEELDKLFEAGEIRVIRRTRSRITYGLVRTP